MQERLLVLKMEEEAMSQGTWAPLDTGKGKKMNSPRAFREKHVAAHTMSLAQRPIFGLLTSRPITEDNKSLLF